MFCNLNFKDDGHGFIFFKQWEYKTLVYYKAAEDDNGSSKMKYCTYNTEM